MLNVDTTPRWVDSSEELAMLCRKWREQKAVALDTEFMRSRTFYPQPALVQVGDGEHCYLIDNLAIENLEPLRELILDTGVTKIMHSCSEDLETLDRLLGAIPEPIFDTQIAAAMTGLGAGLGYAATVNTLLNIELPKSETRSDWLQRPLSEAQKTYAALDVAWLPHIYAILLKRLRESGRSEWLREDCSQLVAAARNPQPPELYYQKVKGAWRLRGKQLAVLQDLCAWREREARLRDVPRNHLLKEGVCLNLAQQLPDHPAAMAQPGLEGRTLREHGDTLLKIINRACERPDAPPALPQPLNRRQGECLKELRKRVSEIAEREGLPAEILVRKKELEALVQAERPTLEGRLRGWRGELIGGVLMQSLGVPQEEPESK
ncbi:ribonuclease D [Microbulbifer flavimaris]|uniref:Ribonuclease D n=1 Tax=Microbulbifer flavimaris TaxID=1781068 RepID=A0ABX4HZC7_9GAMM|nr:MULTISPECIES: ribonuclease D [Microbulbifer]KUJ83355.1 ribonuclease D [Microbulbifer sp. ZGT114]PCO05510.1 ribonuclease D [Microbulbifer flavimaris]